MSNPHQVTRDFEAALARYAGARFAVAVNSCTAALTLAVAWSLRNTNVKQCVEIPARTYVSVPMAIIHAGGWPTFRDEAWLGMYQLKPLPVFDSARWLTSGMYDPGSFQCLSFHWSKTLSISQGGAILHDNEEADAWLRRARFDGRTEGVAPKDDHFEMIGWHCYLSPSVAADGLLRLGLLPKHNEPLPNDDYAPLDQLEIFK